MIIDTFTLLNEFLDYKYRFMDDGKLRKTNLIFETKKSRNMKKINILLKVYDLGNLRNFEEGKFIDDREEEDFEIVYDYIEKEFVFNDEPSHSSTQILFTDLLHYRILFSPLINHFGGILMAGGILKYLPYKSQQINKVIENQLKSIDQILALIISPKQQKFTLEELVKKYNYPNVTDEFEDIDF